MFRIPTIVFLLTAMAVADEPIRALPLPTIVQLGKELYLRDKMAASAFDALFAAEPGAGKLPLRGWITELDPEHPRVYLIQQRDGLDTLAYTVTFHPPEAPKVENKQGAPLPDFVAKRFAARLAAIAAIPKFMTKTYNFEVLDEPDGNGYLVYALAATKNPDEIVAGGHYRVTVTSEGKVQQVDALSRSFLVLPKQAAGAPEDSKPAGITMTHIVSDTPVETHVYLSLLHKTPLYVITSKKDIWKVRDGEITKEAEPVEGAQQNR